MFYALCSARTYIPPSLMTSEQSHYLCVLDVYVMMCTSMPQHTCHNVTVFASIPDLFKATAYYSYETLVTLLSFEM